MPTDATTDLVPVERPKTLQEAKNRGAGVPMQQVGGSYLPAFTDMGQVMEFAALMSSAGPMVGKVCRGNPAACAAVVMMAGRFGLDPFMLSHKAYQTKDDAPMAWEAQAVNAMIMGANALEKPLDYRFEGDGATRRVTVIGRLRGHKEDREITTNTVGGIKVKNSPNWTAEPDQQLAYYGSRLWIRRHAAHILMGVYSIDEVDEIPGGFLNVTPDKADPVARLQANMAQARPAEAAKQPDPPEPDPDPPAAAQPVPQDEAHTDDDQAEPIAAETEGEAGEKPAAGAEPSVRELPPHPGELIRTKKGGLEWAERWAAHYRALPKDAEEAFIDETEEDARLARALNPKAEDVISDALNAPKLPI